MNQAMSTATPNEAGLASGPPMRRLLMINSKTTEEMTRSIVAVAGPAGSPDTTIEASRPDAGPRSVEDFTDEVLAAHGAVNLVSRTVAAMTETPLLASATAPLRQSRDRRVPVVGIVEAAFHVASPIVYRWAIMAVSPRVEPLIREVVRCNDVEASCASSRCAPLSVLEIGEGLGPSENLMPEEAHAAIADDAAEAVLLGCAGPGPLEAIMAENLGVPVLDGTPSHEAARGLGSVGSSPKARCGRDPAHLSRRRHSALYQAA
jgi:allantoin racemase